MKLSDHLNTIILAVIALGLIFNAFKPSKIEIDGYSADEVNYLLEITKLKEEKKILIHQINSIRYDIKKDSTFVYNANERSRDSLRAIYNPR